MFSDPSELDRLLAYLQDNNSIRGCHGLNVNLSYYRTGGIADDKLPMRGGMIS